MRSRSEQPCRFTTNATQAGEKRHDFMSRYRLELVLGLDERQEISVDRFVFRGGHAVREAFVGFQRAILQQGMAPNGTSGEPCMAGRHSFYPQRSGLASWVEQALS
jgi:hypothetical protein